MTKREIEQMLMDVCFSTDLEKRARVGIEVWQDQPYTAVQLDCENYLITNVRPITAYKLLDYVAVEYGFSKVVWPDKWVPYKGYRLALIRAIRKVAAALGE